MLKKFFLDSRHGQGSPCDKLYVAPMGGVRCQRASQHIEIECVEFRMAYTWNSVHAGNNRFTVDAAEVVVPVGNYTFEELACTLEELLVEAGLATATVTYGRPYNTLRFDFGSAVTLGFVNDSHKILGFEAGAAPTGSVIISTRAIDLSPVDTAWVRLEEVSMVGDGCLANCGGELRPLPILLTIPIEATPFARFSFRAGAAEAGQGIAITDRELRSLRIAMTDGDGALLTDFPDYVMTLFVRIVDDHLRTMDANLAAIAANVQNLTDMFGADFTMKHMPAALEHFASLQVEPDAPPHE